MTRPACTVTTVRLRRDPWNDWIDPGTAWFEGRFGTDRRVKGVMDIRGFVRLVHHAIMQVKPVNWLFRCDGFAAPGVFVGRAHRASTMTRSSQNSVVKTSTSSFDIEDGSRT